MYKKRASLNFQDGNIGGYGGQSGPCRESPPHFGEGGSGASLQQLVEKQSDRALGNRPPGAAENAVLSPLAKSRRAAVTGRAQLLAKRGDIERVQIRRNWYQSTIPIRSNSF